MLTISIYHREIKTKSIRNFRRNCLTAFSFEIPYILSKCVRKLKVQWRIYFIHGHCWLAAVFLSHAQTTKIFDVDNNDTTCIVCQKTMWRYFSQHINWRNWIATMDHSSCLSPDDMLLSIHISNRSLEI